MTKEAAKANIYIKRPNLLKPNYKNLMFKLKQLFVKCFNGYNSQSLGVQIDILPKL